MSFTKIAMEINQKVNGKFQKMAEHNIFVPILKDIAAFVAGAEPKVEEGKEVMEDGLPVYTTDQANWVQAAILAYVKADARNKMIPKTGQLKDGKKIAETWEELTAEGVRDGAGLRLAREFKDEFKEWVSTQGLSEVAANTLVTLVGNKAALTLQQQPTKDKVKARLESFAEALDEEKMNKFMKPMENVMQACDAVTNEMDF